MKKINTVKKNDDFSKIIKTGKYYKTKYFVIYIKDNNLERYRFGISIGKKAGKAVTRNKIKRQLRTIIDKYKNDYPNGKDYIIIVKNCFIEASFSEIELLYRKGINYLNRGVNNEKE